MYFSSQILISKLETLWHRVVTAGMERMTAQNALDSQPSALERAVLCDGLQGIFAARWIEPAGGWKRSRDGHLVKAYQPDEDARHNAHLALMRRPVASYGFGLIGRAMRAFFSSHLISSRTSCIFTPGAEMAGLAIKTISQHGSITSTNWRNASRIIRRARLRRTAFPIFLDVIKPTRDAIDAFIPGKSPAGSDDAGKRAALMLQHLPAWKLPSRFTRPNSADVRRRPSIIKTGQIQGLPCPLFASPCAGLALGH